MISRLRETNWYDTKWYHEKSDRRYQPLQVVFMREGDKFESFCDRLSPVQFRLLMGTSRGRAGTKYSLVLFSTRPGLATPRPLERRR